MNDKDKVTLRNAIAYVIETQLFNAQHHNDLGIKAVSVDRSRVPTYEVAADEIAKTIERMGYKKV